jgi:hypothetical protein
VDLLSRVSPDPIRWLIGAIDGGGRSRTTNAKIETAVMEGAKGEWPPKKDEIIKTNMGGL